LASINSDSIKLGSRFHLGLGPDQLWRLCRDSWIGATVNCNCQLSNYLNVCITLSFTKNTKNNNLNFFPFFIAALPKLKTNFSSWWGLIPKPRNLCWLLPTLNNFRKFIATSKPSPISKSSTQVFGQNLFLNCQENTWTEINLKKNWFECCVRLTQLIKNLFWLSPAMNNFRIFIATSKPLPISKNHLIQAFGQNSFLNCKENMWTDNNIEKMYPEKLLQIRNLI
jgi:hypothetical protein